MLQSKRIDGHDDPSELFSHMVGLGITDEQPNLISARMSRTPFSRLRPEMPRALLPPRAPQPHRRKK